MRWYSVLIAPLVVAQIAIAAEPPRARDLGIPFDGSPGESNAITDVAGVTVGHHTLVIDLPNGRKVRTGVTAVLPLGRDTLMQPVFGAWNPVGVNKTVEDFVLPLDASIEGIAPGAFDVAGSVDAENVG